jgi:hypothetical protein
VHTVFWLENLEGRVHLEDLGIDGKLLGWILGKYDGKLWTGFMWLMTETSCGLL